MRVVISPELKAASLRRMAFNCAAFVIWALTGLIAPHVHQHNWQNVVVLAGITVGFVCMFSGSRKYYKLLRRERILHPN